MDLGTRPENVLIMAVDPKTAGYSDQQFRHFLDQLELRLGSLPGVRSVAASSLLPLSLAQSGESFRDTSAADNSKKVGADRFAVTGQYLQTIGIPLLRGRGFSCESDTNTSTIIINQTMAHRLFGDQDPLGRRISAGKDKTYEIIGVAADSKSVTLGEETQARAYTYMPQDPSQQVMSLLGLTILVKSTGNLRALVHPVTTENPAD